MKLKSILFFFIFTAKVFAQTIDPASCFVGYPWDTTQMYWWQVENSQHCFKQLHQTLEDRWECVGIYTAFEERLTPVFAGYCSNYFYTVTNTSTNIPPIITTTNFYPRILCQMNLMTSAGSNFIYKTPKNINTNWSTTINMTGTVYYTAARIQEMKQMIIDLCDYYVPANIT